MIKDLTTENYLDDKYKDRDFSKIYDSYLHKINTINYDFLTKDSIRNNILKIMKEKKITNYRLYTDLKINHGNVNDYLKNANCRKVSLELVEKMFNYVINY